MTEPIDELAQLPRELDPPAALEDQVVRELRRQSLLRPSAPSRWRQLAAAVAIFAIGAAAGRASFTERAAPPPEARYLLLLLAPGPQAGTEDERVAAYGAWAAEQRSAGRRISGERLASGQGITVGPTGNEPSVADQVQGFFIVSASDLDDAIAVARNSPHVRGGGRLAIRPIDTP